MSHRQKGTWFVRKITTIAFEIRAVYPDSARGAEGYLVAPIPDDVVAAQIVREHNAHEALVEALEECKRELGYCEHTLVGLARFSVQEKIKNADAALALAKEEARDK